MVPQEGNRTPDPIITNDVLYQLSYCGAAIGKPGGSARSALLSMPIRAALAICRSQSPAGDRPAGSSRRGRKRFR